MFEGFSFHIDGSCNGKCLDSGTFKFNGTPDEARNLLDKRGAFRSVVDQTIPGLGHSLDEEYFLEHRNTTQHRFGDVPSPHFSVPRDPKTMVPTVGGFHVDTDAPGLQHFGCAVAVSHATSTNHLATRFWCSHRVMVPVGEVRFFAATNKKICFPWRSSNFVVGPYPVFRIHNTESRLNGPRPDFLRMLLWARPGFWISIAALILCVIGKGWSRVLSLIASLPMLGLWAIPIWGL